MCRSLVLCTIVAICILIRDSQQIEESDSLVFVNVVLRHGTRSPDNLAQFPSDPHVNYTYPPFGRSQLRTEGKQAAYTAGERLKEHYGWFLGDVYYPDLIQGISSGYPRTKMTVQLALSALFPPTDEYKLSDDLNWQPIEFRYFKYKDDNVLATFKACPKIFDIIENVERQPQHRAHFEQYKELYQYLTHYSGWKVNNSRSVNFIYDTLKVEKEIGLEIPEWAEAIYPQPIQTVARYFWKLVADNTYLRSICCGKLLQIILEDCKMISEGTYKPSDRKMTLYSGHDFNLAPLLGALGNFNGYHVPYTAYILFELHHIDNSYRLKIFYQDYTSQDPRLLDIPGCGTFCDLEQFTNLMKHNFPIEPWCI